MKEEIIHPGQKTPRAVWVLSPPSAKIKRTRIGCTNGEDGSKNRCMGESDAQRWDMDRSLEDPLCSTLFPSTPTLSCIFQCTATDINTDDALKTPCKPRKPREVIDAGSALEYQHQNGMIDLLNSTESDILANQIATRTNFSSSPVFDSLILDIPKENLEEPPNQRNCEAYSDPIFEDYNLLEKLISQQEISTTDVESMGVDELSESDHMYDDLVNQINVNSIDEVVFNEKEDIYNDCNAISSDDEWFSGVSNQLEFLLSHHNQDYLRFKIVRSSQENGVRILHAMLDGKGSIVTDSLGQVLFEIRLFDEWLYGEAQTPHSLKPLDIINVLGPVYKFLKLLNHSQVILIDLTVSDAHEYLWIVVHPDIMVQGTTLADSFSCMRRAIVSLLYPGKAANSKNLERTDGGSNLHFPESWIIGNILHEVFQSCLSHNNFKKEFIDSIVAKTLVEHIEAISMDPQVDVNIPQLHELIISYAPSIIKWHQKYGSSSEGSLSVNEVLDIEETIWSVKYGLKGKVDATLSIIEPKGYKRCVPFELKTGRRPSSVCHRAQTLLYALMLHSKRGNFFCIESFDGLVGFLLYLNRSTNPSDMDIINGKSNEILDILRARNRVSSYLTHRGALLPEILPEERSFQCDTCYARSYCMTLKAVENVSKNEPKSAFLGIEYEHNNAFDPDIDFFHQWTDFVAKEEQIVHDERSELWSLTSEERRKLGRCINGLRLESCEQFGGRDMSLFRSFKCIFIADTKGLDFVSDTQIFLFDPILVSIDDSFPLNERKIRAIGYVTLISSEEITVTLDRRIIDESGIQGYRIDKDEQLMSFGMQRSSLLHLLSRTIFPDHHVDKDHSCKIPPKPSRLIVHMDPPQWHEESGLNDELNMLNHFITEHPYLNQDQISVLKRSLLAKDYHLVVGMPGSGKSTTIALLIELLVLLNKTVLICSYTHNAVDLVVSKLQHINEKCIYWRLGSSSRTNDAVNQEASLVHAIKNMTHDGDLISKTRELWKSRPVVACTALQVNQSASILQYLSHFDYCIIDEATQLPTPLLLECFRISDKWVMVGDSRQLPPLTRAMHSVVMKEEDGMDGSCTIQMQPSISSLFSTLSEKWPSSVSVLSYQYRMHHAIMSLANNLIYENHMKCGSDMQNSKLWPTLPDTFTYFEKFVILNELVFINCPVQESRMSGFVVNKGEVQCVSYVLNLLHRITSSNPSQLAPQISILSPYKAQVKLLSSICSDKNIHISTIDKYQGKENDIVLISLVRSNEDKKIGNLLESWQRVNVAITRAKKKLVLIGSIETLSSNEFLKKLIEYCKQTNHLITMPEIDSFV